jgi:membrane-bound metal-dependent hydrolase YbcI (DUF457 family)
LDLFTHVLTAYLLTYGLVGFQPSYLAAGALAGGLPDGDILLYPLWKRFPILRHHGITHSFTGITIIALGGAVVGPQLAPGSPLVYFAVMWVAGALHVLEDAFTNFSVPPFLPFSKQRVQLDADRAVNFVTMAISIFSFYLLLGVERNHVPFATYLATVYVLMLFFVAYFALRVGLRLYLGRHLKEIGPFDVPVATSNPLVWLLLAESKDGGVLRSAYGRYVFGRGLVEGPYELTAPMDPEPDRTGPVQDRAEAVRRSYPIARRALTALDDTYHFAETHDADGRWDVTWYSLEFAAFGRAMAVRVAFDDAGAATVKRAWFHPKLARPG